MTSELFFFQCGRFPKISFEEIVCRFPKSSAKSLLVSNVLVIKFKDLLSLSKKETQQTYNELGSSIRCGRILGEFARVLDIQDEIYKQIYKKYEKSHQKILFGISSFPPDARRNFLKTLLIGVKKECQKNNIPIRFVNRNFQNLDAGTYHKEQLGKENNVEFCIFSEKKGFVLAETLAAQDVEAFAKRDFGKPVRDMHVGMLPPKLALIMVNLSRNTAGDLPHEIWDPFCGTGSIVIEAARLVVDCFGSDLASKMVVATKENIKHFFPDFNTQNIIQHDATKPFSGKKESHAVVTEGYLGPICSKPLSESEFQKLGTKITSIYQGFFEHATAETIIISLPFWRKTGGGYWYLQKVLESAKSFGYIASAFGNGTERGSLEFMRKGQIVGREIFRFHRT